MFVTEIDQSYEKYILNLLLPKVPEFKFLTARSLGGASIYDFSAFKKDEQVAELDIKVRDERSDTYKDYFISKEKIIRLRKNPSLNFYVIYYFKGDKKIRIYDLRRCQLEERWIKFIHKRSGEPVESLVFCIPAGQFMFEAYLM